MALLRTAESLTPAEILPPFLKHLKKEPLPSVAPELLQWQRKPFKLSSADRNGFVRIPQQDIMSCLALLRRDPMVRTAVKTVASALFRGGILVMGSKPTQGKSHGDDSLPSYTSEQIGIDTFVAASANKSTSAREESRRSASKEVQDEEDEYLSRILTRFAADLHEYAQAVGFCPWVAVPNAHPVYLYRPQRLNLERVTVWYKYNMFGECMFAFTATPEVINEILDFSMLGLHSLVPFGDNQFIIPGVFVEVWHKPDINGCLTSPVMPLIEPLEMFAVLRHCHMAASVSASAPVHVIQTKPPLDLGLQNRNLLKDSYLEQEAYSARDGAERSNGPRRIEGVVNRALDQIVGLANQWHGGPHQFEQIREGLIRSLHETVGKMMSNRIYLDDYEEVAKAPEARSPVDFTKTEVMVQQMVMMAFSLPPAMLQAESSRGRMNLDYNAMRVFNDAQQQLMSEMQRALQHVAEGIWAPARLARYAMDTALVEQISEEEARKHMKIHVVIPNIPSPEDIRSLHEEGVLKYDAYCEFMGQIYSIPRDRFEKTRRMDRMDVKTSTRQAGGTARRTRDMHPTTALRQREKRMKATVERRSGKG